MVGPGRAVQGKLAGVGLATMLGLLLPLIATLALSACLIDVERGRYVQGRTLTVGVTQIRKVSEIGYSNTERTTHYVIRPKDPEKNTLALASVTVANHRSARVLMHVNTAAAYVDDKANKRYVVIDPFQERVEAPSPAKDENLYIPFLWGTAQLDLDTQVTGWMVFEIPKEQEVVRFGWQQGENIVVRFTGP